MGAIGDMDSYMKFKTARAEGDAATAGGEAGGATQTGLGLGAGLAAARVLADSMTSSPQQPAAPATGGGAAGSDPVSTLRTLKELLDGGLISQEEYDVKRAEVLKRL
jgi:membrane protease subunit (stomatin/prohibitin family)